MTRDAPVFARDLNVDVVVVHSAHLTGAIVATGWVLARMLCAGSSKTAEIITGTGGIPMNHS